MGSPGWKMFGVECPECGDLRTGVSNGGFDSEGHRIRNRVCRNCEEHFTTLEIPIPFIFNRMDVAKADRELSRLKRKFPGSRTSVPRRLQDYFTVTLTDGDQRHNHENRGATIRFHKGTKSDICRSGLHLIRGANAIIRPSGRRHCRACANKRTSERRREFRRRFPTIAREEDAMRRARRKENAAMRRAEASAA